MANQRQIRFLEEMEGCKIGEVIWTETKSAEQLIKRGYAEYIGQSGKSSDRQILIQRLKEAGLSTRRFLKVGEDKAAFEFEWEKHLYGPEDLDKYLRWGVNGKDGLVPCDVDKPEMIKVFREQLPETLVVVSPRRGLPHFYYKVVGGEVPNKTLHIPGDYDEKGRLRGAGEIRAQNQYLVAPGTTIKYKDLKTGEPKTGTYKIVEDRPIATVTFERFMEVIKPYLGKDSSQKITKEIMENGVAQGTRHAYGIRYATRLIRFEKLDPVASLDILKRWNQKNQPPMKEKDLERMVENAVGYAQDDPQETRRKPPKAEVFGEGFHLRRQGKFVYLCDKEGGAVATCKLKNVAGRDFKKTMKERTNLTNEEIDRITAKFQLKHQKHSKKTQVKDKAKEEIAFDNETVYHAWQLVRDPQFFWKIGKVFEHGFIVSKLNKPRFVLGEERNKRLVGPLLIGAAKLGMASIIKLLGESGTAKDTMLRMWLDILPIKYIERSYFTAAALRYSQSMKNADLLYIPDSPELRGEMGRQLRFMRSDDGGLLSEYATKDQETGEMTTKLVELPIKGVATTSNSITGDPALESGMFTLTTNGTKELTDEVKKEKLKLRADNRPLFPEDELEVVKCAFHILLTEDLPETLPRVPFAEALFDMLESDRSTSRRDPDKLCDLISLIAWFRRFQKEPAERADADFVDLYIAFQIGLDALTQTMGDLDEKEIQVFDAVNEAIKDKVAEADTALNATIRDVTEITKIPYETTRRYLDKLVDKGFLNKDKEKNRNVYSVLEKNRDKKLIFSSMRSSSEAKQLTTTILDAVKNSSTHHEGRTLSYFDPLTGDKIVVNFERNSDEVKFSVTTEINDTLYPYGEMRRSQQGKETISEREKKLKNLPIDQLVRKNNEKLRKKPKCKNLTTLEDQPFCKFLDSLLVNPKQCNSSCAGWEASSN